MGKHKTWRKIAKRERRRKMRKANAYHRDNPLPHDSVEYKQWLVMQEQEERMELEHIQMVNEQENAKWLQAEQVSMEQWLKAQEKIRRAHQKQIELQEKKRLEWEMEQNKIREANEKLQKIQEENERLQKVFLARLEEFISGGANEAPEELLVTRETKPASEPCPFFSKTACCRFGDECSRNHKFCGISNVLLAKNFFTNFGLENSKSNEYDTDVLLEFEDSDTYRDFKEFFYDVVPEFEKFGKVVQFKVCNNFEKHLRGNVYVEFAEMRGAVAAYRALHCRWYGGRQLSLTFCQINSWKNAVCGLQSSKRCPKGRACNFLHVFKNPDSRFDNYQLKNNFTRRRSKSRERSWRWSESPEVEMPKHRRSRDTSDRQSRDKSERKSRNTSDRQSKDTSDRQLRDISDRRSREKSDRQQRAGSERTSRDATERFTRDTSPSDRQLRDRIERSHTDTSDRQPSDRQTREASDRQSRDASDRRHKSSRSSKHTHSRKRSYSRSRSRSH